VSLSISHVQTYTLTYASVVELNAGIICCCMPVLPVLLKHVAKSDTYRKSVSALRNFRGSRGSTSDLGKDKDRNSNPRDPKYEVKVAVPKPTMTGLRTFIWGGNKSQMLPTIRNNSFAPLESWDDDYHKQLKACR